MEAGAVADEKSRQVKEAAEMLEIMMTVEKKAL